VTDEDRSSALARFVATQERAGLPDEVVHEARRALVDHLAVVIAGVDDPTTARVRDVLLDTCASRAATVLGTGTRASAPHAAFVNAFASHVLDLDDVYNPPGTTVHGSCSVWPAIFAMAELVPVTGERAMTAFVVGFETETRVAHASGQSHYDAGWHVTGTSGHVGAGAAVAHAARLDAVATGHALGAAATQAAGLRVMAGSDLKSMHPAKAAHDAVLAVLLARAGLTAGDRPLDGDYGYLDVMSSQPEPHQLDRALGASWNLLANGYKLYPSGSLTHPVVDAVIGVVSDGTVTGGDIASLELRVSVPAARFTDLRDPTTPMQAKFSLTHCAAAAALHGKLGPAELEPAVLHDPRVDHLRRLVTVVADSSLGKQDAVVTVRLSSGEGLAREVRGNRGTPAAPLTDRELADKFVSLVEPRLGTMPANRVLEACWNLDRVDDLRSIAALTTEAVRV
jgi:2-methylcitrate dehydratase PrpD